MISYRCRSQYGWITIAAGDDEDAWREALRSSNTADLATLERWDGAGYVRCAKEPEAA